MAKIPRFGFSRARSKSVAGFTLVELLVVITIIGILVSLLLPAVQSAREAGRASVCQNNLHQIGVACVAHQEKYGWFPSTGWGCKWTGDADRGAGLDQPGGWIYNILPFCEQKNLWQLPSDGDREEITSEQLQGALRMSETPVSFFACPSRRSGSAHPYALQSNWDQYNGVKTGECKFRAANDYSANAGQSPGHGEGRYPSSHSAAKDFGWVAQSGFSGVMYQRGQCRPAMIKDGLSNTYLACEKYLNSDWYFTSQGGSDNHPMYQGHDRDVIVGGHQTHYRPARDQAGSERVFVCGSSHPSSFMSVMADGSVVPISFQVEQEIHWRLSHRNDGRPMSRSMLP